LTWPRQRAATAGHILVLLAADGDELAYGELVRRHSSAVRVLMRRLGASAATADDMAQEAFLAGWKHVRSLREGGAFEPWIKRIAARLYVRQWRANRRYIALDEADEGVIEPNSGLKLDLDAALEALRPVERLCISLSVGAGFSHPEVAESLGLPLGSVKSYVKRGLDKLRSRLDPQGE
jgi:RNA polymerase sigma-70 factor (ECF subfamily)